jgi:hypothetical protein
MRHGTGIGAAPRAVLARKSPVTVNRLPGITCVNSVGVAGFNLNPALASYLHERREAVAAGVEPVRVQPVHAPVPKRRPVAVRLSDVQVTAIVERYQSGETARSLAAEFGLGLTAMKSLLRKHGARKR